MPKEAARLFLRVTSVRVERLQGITEVGAADEGAEGTPCGDCGERDYGSRYEFCTTCANTGWVKSPKEEFKGIWDSTIRSADLPAYGWEANPWVWVIEFERISKEEAMKGETDGNADIIGVLSTDICGALGFDDLNRVTRAMNRLAAYEDTELEPEEVAVLEAKNEVLGQENDRLKAEIKRLHGENFWLTGGMGHEKG